MGTILKSVLFVRSSDESIISFSAKNKSSSFSADERRRNDGTYLQFVEEYMSFDETCGIFKYITEVVWNKVSEV